MNSDGPGVTTLSLGEEEGLGDFLSRPIVDGSDFLEPAVTSFASTASTGPATAQMSIGETAPADSYSQISDLEITTLAIGEEDGGASGSSSIEIGRTYAESYAPFEPVSTRGAFMANPGGQVASAASSVSPGYGRMDPIYSPLDNSVKGGTSGIAAIMAPATAAPAVTAPVLATKPIVTARTQASYAASPRIKPAAIASSGAPLPGAKPENVPAGVPLPGVKPDIGPTLTAKPMPLPGLKPAMEPASVSTATTAVAETPDASAGKPLDVPSEGLTIADILDEAKQVPVKTTDGTISVGDYDAFMAAEGGQVPASKYEFGDNAVNSEAASGMTPAFAREISTTETADTAPLAVEMPGAESDPSPVYSTHYEFSPAETEAGAASEASPEPVYETYYQVQPAETAPASGGTTEPVYSTQYDFGTPQPDAAADTKPLPEPVYSTTFSAPPSELESMSAPDVKPEAAPAATDTPEPESGASGLTDDDFRITTLALGEEEAGGG